MSPHEAHDREWFGRNPGRRHRVRGVLPGDVPQWVAHPCVFVAVRRSPSGEHEGRIFISELYPEQLDNEATASRIFDGLGGDEAALSAAGLHKPNFDEYCREVLNTVQAAGNA